LDAAPCPVCGMPNVTHALVCERCGMPLVRPHPTFPPPAESASPLPSHDSEPSVIPPEPETELEEEPVAATAPEHKPTAGSDAEQLVVAGTTSDGPAVTGVAPDELAVTGAMADDLTGAAPDEPTVAAAQPTPVPRTKQVASVWSRLKVATRGHLRDQLGRILIGAVVGLLLLVVLVALLPPTPHTNQAAQDVPQVAVPTSTLAPKSAKTQSAATTGPTSHQTIVREVRVLGEKAGLLAPQEAVQLRNGTIAVVDTGHKRLVFLDAHGKLLKSVTAGASPLQEPFAAAAAGGTLYVLDSERDTIDRFDAQGQYRGTVIHDPTLHHARGMALGRNGTLLVANPSTNSVLTLSRSGDILHTFAGSVGTGPTKLDQPSDVASGNNGSIYILDNNNQRVQIVNAAGTFSGQRPAPPSSTISSAHVLPLPDGRLLVSDPTGSLLLYPPNGGSATRIVLQVKGDPSARISPLGLALATGGRVLVTDTMGNRILVISSSQL
jgi:DNA-binding beta-propeller fold protein YncE